VDGRGVRSTASYTTREVLELLHGPPKLAVVLKDVSKDAEAIDRYERRVLSQLKFAIRNFDLICSQENKEPNPNEAIVTPSAF
jgi:hypothetical protein